MWGTEVVTEECTISEFKVYNGSAQSKFGNIKLLDTAGGYAYNLLNRNLYWRTQGDSIEINEVSRNYKLIGNRVRFRFVDTPLLPGTTVHETLDNVVILIPTMGSIHKLSFTHPSRMEGIKLYDGVRGLLSVLGEASIKKALECQHVFNWPANTPHLSTATTYFTQDKVGYGHTTNFILI